MQRAQFVFRLSSSWASAVLAHVCVQIVESGLISVRAACRWLERLTTCRLTRQLVMDKEYNLDFVTIVLHANFDPTVIRTSRTV